MGLLPLFPHCHVITATTTLSLILLVVTQLRPTEALPSGSPKPGACPEGFQSDVAIIPQNSSICTSPVVECDSDSSCRGPLKCCSNGCATLCMMPLLTGCQQLRMARERQMRVLGGDKNIGIDPLQCDEGTGEFERIQCNDLKTSCWCVDRQGFEQPGTRARTLELVNCSAPKECAGYLCRMLCPYGFELDEEGCPLCECRNPCKNVKCPAGQDCQLDERPCAHPPCPPLPTCRKPRSLTNLCPVGEPLKSPDVNRPFLCGIQPTKPQCPLNYLCNVEAGNDYGVCCPLSDKPGQCPSPSDTNGSECGGQECESDMDCEDVKKCCYSSGCGYNTCLKPANSSLCLQQKAVVELLIKTNDKYHGYVPQCAENGDFVPKQCSNNGLLCWCVDDKGVQIKGTMGPAPAVSCEVEGRSHAASTPSLSFKSCEPSTCDLECKWGYQYDENGCVQCECADPCKDFHCPFGSECIIMKEDPCVSGFCPPIATCSQRQKICAQGSPILDGYSGKPMICSDKDDAKKCPDMHECVVIEDDGRGVCCIKDKVVAPKGGTCPAIPFDSPLPCRTDGKNSCESDHDCEGDMKCCDSGKCGKVCIMPRFKKLPTMCEYLREVGNHLEESNATETLAIPIPQCRIDGSYDPIQCDRRSGECWCVDEFGVELQNTRASSRSEVNCLQVRARLDCLGLLCRLGCEYGFELDEGGCPQCECRDPCKGVRCPENHECQLVEVKCFSDWCPPVPQCVLQQSLEILQRNFLQCPIGSPLLYDTNNGSDLPVMCDPETKQYQCPNSHHCYREDSKGPGICCPKTGYSAEDEKEGKCPKVKAWEIGVCAEQCSTDHDCPGPQKCCLNGCNSKVCRNPEGSQGKPGQCPYLIPLSSERCEYRCSSDYDCDGDAKCCSNGCGTECSRPLKLTGCQHQRMVSEYHAREKGLSTSQHFIPECRREDGRFEDIQCDLRNKVCWCVDENSGFELLGTRGPSGKGINCTAPRHCPDVMCDAPCEYGWKVDKDGCPVCECQDPCEGVKCNGLREECQVVQVNCISEPCPPIALCVPKEDNICPFGEPMKLEDGTYLQCGPLGSQCPSSHKCHLSPLKDSGVCCLKPRSVCYSKRDAGHCKATIPRWFYNKAKNHCEEFQYSGCGGNLNNFENKEHCESICPASSCERIRERNLKLKANFNKVIFVPKCLKTGEWAPIQCLDSVGLCWCVDQNGNQLSGTVVRGTPACSSRGGRSLEEIPICTNGEPVHICPPDMCHNKICLNYSDAVCRINPCGGCKIEFYDSKNNLLDCSRGLSACQEEVQRVLNSKAWLNQGIPENKLDENSSLDAPSDDSYLSPPPPAYPPPPPPPFGMLNRVPEERYFSEAFDMMASENRERPVRVARNTRQQPLPFPISVARNVRILQVPASRISVLVAPNMQDVTIRMSTDLMPLMEIMKELTPMESFDDKPLVKGGMCPLPSLPSIISSMLRGCRDRCMIDSDCPGKKKCCLGSCGLTCVDPLVLVPRNVGPKPGRCPPMTYWAKNKDSISCLTPQQECLFDEDCTGSAKCCSTPCGHACTEPQVRKAESKLKPSVTNSDVKPIAMVLAPPKCSPEGGYSITQQQGELSWCVNKYGEPYHDTLTRGMVRCTSNGTVTAREELGPVCPGGNDAKPQVCKTECLFAQCMQHPEAICVADPCNNCTVTFVNKEGKPVNCDAKCSQDVKSERCPQSRPHYFFNHTSNRCEEVMYGDCGEQEGNKISDNLFDTLGECAKECAKPVPVCEQPMVHGTCNDHITRWFYNKLTHQCEQFDYTGCGGNDNNFETQELCEARCPDLVICPWASIGGGGDLQPCSREQSCSNSSCPANPDALCTADPCTCMPVFVDLHGNPVGCEISTSDTKDFPFLMSPEIAESTRCLHLQSQHTPDRRSRYIPQCDRNGEFVPMQCATPQMEQSDVKECWCVDEAGNQLPGTSTFKPGSVTCNKVKIKQVDVTLAFGQDSYEDAIRKKKHIKNLMKQFLDDLKAHIDEKEPQIAVELKMTNILFTLVGDRKMQVAFKIEEMVRREALSMVFEDVIMPIDYRNSHFYYVPEYVAASSGKQLEVINLSENVILDHLTMVEAKPKEAFSTGTIIAIVVIALFFMCTMIFLFGALMVHRKKSKGYKPKSGFPTLAFNSPVYDLAVKIFKGQKVVGDENNDVNLEKVQTIRTVEAEYEALQKKAAEAAETQSMASNYTTTSSDLPPTYEEVKPPSVVIEEEVAEKRSSEDNCEDCKEHKMMETSKDEITQK